MLQSPTARPKALGVIRMLRGLVLIGLADAWASDSGSSPIDAAYCVNAWLWRFGWPP
jgi:hypothetical protein